MFRKNWAFITIGIVSLLLGAVALLTAMRLRQEEPVAPTAPTDQQAAEGTPVPACQLTFTLGSGASPSPSPSGSPGTSPSSSPSVTPSPSPSVTPSPSSIGGPSCNTSCSTSSQCPSSMTCIIASGQTSGFCRNPSCTSNTSCICASVSPSPTPPPQCGKTCTSSSQCPSSMSCYISSGQTTGVCRNPSCQTDSDCICQGSPVLSVSPSPTPSVTPKVPVAGTSWPTIFMVVGGMALLIIGFAL